MGLLPANLRPDLDALRVDVAVAALRDVVKDGWSVLGLSTGMVDALADQTGIASLGGATYDGSAKTVGNPGGLSGNLAAGVTVAASGTAAGAASDIVNGDTSTTSFYLTSGVGQYVTLDLGAAYAVTQVTYYGNGGDNPQAAKLRYSDDGSAWTDGPSISIANAAGAQSFTWASVGAHRYWRFQTTAAAYSGPHYAIRELQLYGTLTPVAATVVSNAFALGFQPSQARIVAPMELGAGVLGTNGLLDLSRDGSTWAAVTLSDLGKFDANTRIVGGLVNLAGQPAGSSIYWRWRTTAGVAQALHGAWVQCK